MSQPHNRITPSYTNEWHTPDRFLAAFRDYGAVYAPARAARGAAQIGGAA